MRPPTHAVGGSDSVYRENSKRKITRIFNASRKTLLKEHFPILTERPMPSAKPSKQSPGLQALTSFASDPGIVVAIAVVLITVYIFDTMTPLGEPVWLLYFIPLILSFWSSRYYAIPAVCAVTLLFLIGGFFFSPEGISVPHAILYRLTFFLAFISLSIILWAIRRWQILGERL